MIVTKELAKKYLIKRTAWFIETAPNGDYMMALRSVNWLEGMELFEDQEECRREVERRRAERMASGHCPRCKYRHAVETEKDLTYLPVIGKPKGLKLVQCPECRSVWITKPGWKISKAYDSSLLDYVLEWGSRDLAPNDDQKKILRGIRSISIDDSELYPAHVILNDGTEIPTAMIRLRTEPPPPEWFEKRAWHYFDTIKELRPSELAYSYGIAKEIMKSLGAGKFEMIYLKDRATEKLYSFECHAGVFMPKELTGKDLGIFTGEETRSAFNYFMPDERGGPDWWQMTQPPRTVSIWGDL